VTRRRVDLVLVARGLFPTRAKAQEAIAAGLVEADGRVVSRPSDLVDESAEIRAERPYPWVSRGGVKLAAALEAFGVDPAGQICLDVGASTGGFSQVLLTRGAERVYASDVGRGQLHASLAEEPRLVGLEGVDARTLTTALIPTPPTLVVCDVSFISLKLALPTPLALAAPDAHLIALIKPQFEAGPERVKKGIVKDPDVHRAVCEDISAFLEANGWRVTGLAPSPIAGRDGNREFLICATKGGGSAPRDEA
jgi:23S rRNA (cytidine1920-2'-O)/16S rRNA (cytidine1409-2'-O)-methyltransferase